MEIPSELNEAFAEVVGEFKGQNAAISPEELKKLVSDALKSMQGKPPKDEKKLWRVARMISMPCLSFHLCRPCGQRFFKSSDKVQELENGDIEVKVKLCKLCHTKNVALKDALAEWNKSDYEANGKKY